MATRAHTRKPLTLRHTLKAAIAEMSEGNPGALNVLCNLALHDPVEGLFLVLALDDMNMRSSQIWVGYKDYCGEDMEKFKAAIKQRDPAMIAKVNEELGPDWPPAVVGGWSSNPT